MKQEQEKLERFFTTAVLKQRGEFYPESHLQNVVDLSNDFQWPEAVVDSLYRIACQFGAEVRQLGEQLAQGKITIQEAKERTEIPLYYYIPAECRREELEMELDSCGYVGEFEKESSEHKPGSDPDKPGGSG